MTRGFEIRKTAYDDLMQAVIFGQCLYIASIYSCPLKNKSLVLKQPHLTWRGARRRAGALCKFEVESLASSSCGDPESNFLVMLCTSDSPYANEYKKHAYSLKQVSSLD